MTTEADVATQESVPAHHAEDVVDALETEAEDVARHQAERAIETLAARREVTDRQRAVVEALASNLVENLVAAPRHTLREETTTSGQPTVETAMALFDLERIDETATEVGGTAR